MQTKLSVLITTTMPKPFQLTVGYLYPKLKIFIVLCLVKTNNLVMKPSFGPSRQLKVVNYFQKCCKEEPHDSQ